MSKAFQLNMTLELMSKAFQLNNTTLTNNNQRSLSNPCYSQIAHSGMNIDQDRQMLMVDDNVGNQFSQNAVQSVGLLVGQNVVQNQGVTTIREWIIMPATAQSSQGNRMLLIFKKQMLIAQKKEAGTQLTQEEFDFIDDACAYEEIERVNSNYTLKDNLQQASTSGTQTDNAPVYDSDESAEVHHPKNCYDNDIFNMFTQEEQYTKLLEPIPELHKVQQNDSNVISAVSSVEQSRETVEQQPANVEGTRALYDSLYHNLAIEVEKVNLS
ncbi:hypothetical protein Tco_1255597 [Tanacetum coccineum]